MSLDRSCPRLQEKVRFTQQMKNALLERLQERVLFTQQMQIRNNLESIRRKNIHQSSMGMYTYQEIMATTSVCWGIRRACLRYGETLPSFCYFSMNVGWFKGGPDVFFVPCVSGVLPELLLLSFLSWCYK
ncbi:hypothetical protein K7X08_019279 [Anisodus acutangulus]|uniref:Uncharacterized protein n=1 Tax=Anisodus acutangulus TaxID=402998 RepID=A0A9Q1MS49_9SOLA|nr:hypothetical protein K7X08_019279 [Anisodus acutangulus]